MVLDISTQHTRIFQQEVLYREQACRLPSPELLCQKSGFCEGILSFLAEASAKECRNPLKPIFLARQDERELFMLCKAVR